MENEKHPCKVERYDGDIDGLARDIADLRYDVLADLIGQLAANIHGDAQQDIRSGKHRLGRKLCALASSLGVSADTAQSAWRICEPYM